MQVKGDLFVTGELHGITFTDGAVTFSRQPRLTFDQGGFYLTPMADGTPKVNSRGIVFTDGISGYVNPTKVGFSSNFYLSGNSNKETTVNLRNPIFKSVSLEFPGAAENIMIYRAHEAMRILSCRAVVVGSSTPSVSFQIKSGTDRTSLGVSHTVSTAITSTTTGVNVGVSTAVIPAGSFVCLVTTAQSGTVTELDVSLQVEFV